MKQVDEEAMKIRAGLAASIEFWRKRYNMKKRALSEASGVPERTLYHILKRDTGATVDDIGKLAHGLKIEPSTLLKPRKDNGSDE